MEDLKTSEWENSYRSGDNRTFWPLEEVVRFLARHVVKRIGPNERKWRPPFGPGASFLDFGCGAGRHLKMASDLGFNVCGVDLSSTAIKAAQLWLATDGHFNSSCYDESNIIAGPDALSKIKRKKFDVILSASCLDSMHFSVARSFIGEFHERLQAHGLFIFDLISGDETGRPKDFNEDVTVQDQIEKGTIQSYYNMNKIKTLLDGRFEIIENILLRSEDLKRDTYSSRYFLACRKIV